MPASGWLWQVVSFDVSISTGILPITPSHDRLVLTNTGSVLFDAVSSYLITSDKEALCYPAFVCLSVY